MDPSNGRHLLLGPAFDMKSGSREGHLGSLLGGQVAPRMFGMMMQPATAHVATPLSSRSHSQVQTSAHHQVGIVLEGGVHSHAPGSGCDAAAVSRETVLSAAHLVWGTSQHHQPAVVQQAPSRLHPGMRDT